MGGVIMVGEVSNYVYKVCYEGGGVGGVKSETTYIQTGKGES